MTEKWHYADWLKYLLIDRRDHGYDLREAGKHRRNRAQDRVGALDVLRVRLPLREIHPMARVVKATAQFVSVRERVIP